LPELILRVVCIAADRRMAIFPDAMTFKEAGLEGVESLSWYGLFGPAGLPDTPVAQINRDLKKIRPSLPSSNRCKTRVRRSC